MKKYIVIISLLVFTSGCIKFELGNVVSDTVDASKDLYTTIKRKKNGEEERKYTHSVLSVDENADLENIAKCKQQVKQIIADSGYQLREVLSESSETTMVDDARSVKCTLLVVVRK